MSGLRTIPARSGKAAFARKGQKVRVVNTHGQQVVDTWAFARRDLREFMSMEHTRATLTKMIPEVGDALYSNRRRAILTLVEDTSPGVHDTLLAACDDYRYGLLGCTEYHDNCTDNLAAALYELGLTPPETPCPLNLFMNIPWEDGGGLSFDAPVTKNRATMCCSRPISMSSSPSPPARRTSCRSTARRAIRPKRISRFWTDRLQSSCNTIALR